MGAIGEEDLMNYGKSQGVGSGGDEKILVLVRLRPLNEKELARNEVADWECINSTTVLYRNSLQERSGLPTTYSFDRVFRGDCATREVYEEGTKDIALSVVGGINSTIFAYGQTSSGKTYTMNGITEYTVADIYEYIQKHEERAFVLKFSAMEIYNEVVRDLLSTDNIQLRLLDDPEKGTIIEKLTEETLRDWRHLKELLGICEAQRKVGETSLNETSSRSHQILRLTIESSAREFLGKGNSTTLSASVNFVDLAGSERASQALSAGQRLKEGCHINRSLLTLGTVIRKLSKGRHGHVNYRDSKLTRILQPALGGNARTAIICTLSPARAHVEQSRNTLLFASCAKEVSTNAQVNVVLSDKALVKQLQKEVARLESELRTPGSVCDHLPLLRKKDLQIEKLEKEVREMKKQRENDQSRIQKLLQDTEDKQSSRKIPAIQPVNGDLRNNRRSDLLLENSCCSSDDFSNQSQGTQGLPLETAEDCDDDICREVRCIDIHESGQREACQSYGLSSDDTVESMPPLLETQNAPMHQDIPIIPRQFTFSERIHSRGTLEQNIQNMQKSIDSLVRCPPDASSPGASSSTVGGSGSLKFTRSQSCRQSLTSGSHDFEMAVQSETTPPSVLDKNFTGRPEVGFLRKQWKFPPVIYGADSARLCRNDSQSSDSGSFMDDMKDQNSSNGDDDIPTLGSFVAGLREMAKLQYESRTKDRVGETGKIDEKDARDAAYESVQDWPLKFEKMQKSIIELWKTCNVSLVHRTYFVLLIKDDLADSIFMEVEHRRLAFLKETFSKGNSAVQNGRTLTAGSSKKALRREREMLSRLMHKRYTEEERNTLYEEWDISLSSKRRRLQLVQMLWSNSENIGHIKKSAEIVAKLIGFSDQDLALKEMFGLSFTPPKMSRRSFGWKNSMPYLS